MIPGLVSITFRSRTPEEIIDLAAGAGLKTIEWGGDIHVPPGDLALADEVGRQTRESGLSVAAYGSYYRLGFSEANGAPFAPVLESALALGAPTIRVWAGGKGSNDTPPQERSAIIADALRIADLAQASGVTISLEYHAGTLTDTRDSVQHLMAETAHPALEFLWQPAHGETAEQNVARLREVLPRLRHLHVFHWWPTASDRRPLAEGTERWRRYLDILLGAGETVPCLLEFVRDDSTEQFLDDAVTLRDWCVKA
jgi:sugar phosphate isomerase/epimerase